MLVGNNRSTHLILKLGRLSVANALLDCPDEGGLCLLDELDRGLLLIAQRLLLVRAPFRIISSSIGHLCYNVVSLVSGGG